MYYDFAPSRAKIYYYDNQNEIHIIDYKTKHHISKRIDTRSVFKTYKGEKTTYGPYGINIAPTGFYLSFLDLKTWDLKIIWFDDGLNIKRIYSYRERRGFYIGLNYVEINPRTGKLLRYDWDGNYFLRCPYAGNCKTKPFARHHLQFTRDSVRILTAIRDSVESICIHDPTEDMLLGVNDNDFILLRKFTDHYKFFILTPKSNNIVIINNNMPLTRYRFNRECFCWNMGNYLVWYEW
jgi:hypothetical protein